MASGMTSPNTIQIMHPAANPVHRGRNWLNTSANMKAGTATRGCTRRRTKESKRKNRL